MDRLKALVSTIPPLEIPIPLRQQMPLNITDIFTLFPKLPRELRDAIWTFAARQPRKVALASTLRDPVANLPSTNPRSDSTTLYHAHNPRIALNRPKPYTLLTTNPRYRCSSSCPRCIYEIWNSEPGRQYQQGFWEDVSSLPLELQEHLDVRGNFGTLPLHYSRLDEKGDLHWVDFAVDDFVLKLPVDAQWGTGMSYAAFHDYFNFAKEDMKRIERLEHRISAGTLKDVGVIWYLKKMLKWIELEEFVFWIVEREEDIDEKAKGMGDLRREMWREETDWYLRGKVERLWVVGEEAWPLPKMRWVWVMGEEGEGEV